jgi:uncharacterized membrane protein
MSLFKTISRYVCAAFFVGAGTLHFVIPDFYKSIMPPYIPAHAEMVALSGVAEILLGALLIFRRTQKLAAWGLILLLIAVFPANIYVYQHQDLFGGPPLLHLLRLPLQGVFILWAFWYTRSDRPKPAPAKAAPAEEPTLG